MVERWWRQWSRGQGAVTIASSQCTSAPRRLHATAKAPLRPLATQPRRASCPAQQATPRLCSATRARQTSPPDLVALRAPGACSNRAAPNTETEGTTALCRHNWPGKPGSSVFSETRTTSQPHVITPAPRAWAANIAAHALVIGTVHTRHSDHLTDLARSPPECLGRLLPDDSVMSQHMQSQPPDCFLITHDLPPARPVRGPWRRFLLIAEAGAS